MSHKKLNQLIDHNEYKAAIEKANEISVALAGKSAELENLRKALLEAQTKARPDPGAIERALAIVGGSSIEDPVYASTKSQIDRITTEQQTLLAGLKAANNEAKVIAESLSRDVGAQAIARHKEAVKHILDCLERLCEANRAEMTIRDDIEQLGYYGHGLPAMHFRALGEIKDATGSAAYYYAKEARRYL